SNIYETIRMSEDIRKLPLWAQNRIKKLESDNKHLQQLLSQTGCGDSDVSWGYAGEDIAGIPADARIKFKLGDCRIDVYRVGDRLELYSRGGLSDALVVYPHVTNVVRI